MAKIVKDTLYDRTKGGFGVTSEDNPPETTLKRQLPRLSPSYVELREEYVRSGFPLGPRGRVNFANNTFTGQMLEALTFRITSEGFEVFINNNRRADTVITNAQIKAELTFKQPGRKFLALTNEEYTHLLKEFEKLVIREINRIFK